MIDLLRGSLLESKVRHRGKKYSIGRSDSRMLDLLRNVAWNPACQTARGLLMLRPRIRRAMLYPSPVLLSCVLDTTENTRVLRVVMWMLGKIGHPYATRSVALHVDHAEFSVRREAIRSLRRLHAWTELRRISRDHSDPRIRALAEPMSPIAYEDRLANFLARRKAIQPSAVTRKLVVDPHVEVARPHPPKSGWRIGLVLQQIHRLVQRTRRKRRLLELSRRLAYSRLRCFGRAH
jgi:hypothetical protein